MKLTTSEVRHLLSHNLFRHSDQLCGNKCRTSEYRKGRPGGLPCVITLHFFYFYYFYYFFHFPHFFHYSNWLPD